MEVFEFALIVDRDVLLMFPSILSSQRPPGRDVWISLSKKRILFNASVAYFHL